MSKRIERWTADEHRMHRGGTEMEVGTRVTVFVGRKGDKVPCMGTVVEPGNSLALGYAAKVRIDEGENTRLAERCIMVKIDSIAQGGNEGN